MSVRIFWSLPGRFVRRVRHQTWPRVVSPTCGHGIPVIVRRIVVNVFERHCTVIVASKFFLRFSEKGRITLSATVRGLKSNKVEFDFVSCPDLRLCRCFYTTNGRKWLRVQERLIDAFEGTGAATDAELRSIFQQAHIAVSFVYTALWSQIMVIVIDGTEGYASGGN